MTSQRGGFAIGLIVGLLIGLALALGVALYVTKVPVPFINKVPQRTAEQDAAEAERNKNWDPNAPLAGKSPVKPGVPASGATATSPPAGIAVAPLSAPGGKSTAAAASVPSSKRDPAAILAGQAPTSAVTTATARSTKPGADPFTYFVQVGAYARQEDAEQQRARVGLMGVTAKVTEREQSGRTVYRVRVGPYERKEDADVLQEKLAGNGVEAALVRVER
ncbi:MAG: SPOR domain-containing protein [Aquincola sp.]|nr:SPOR domain-containing protein [Aquincola sp.]MDH4287516.1 SPOR domain-containing protein [Aquincola sp.]MDH5328872.1 SPOR domain-containing protein [Aquincola sp.]